MAKGNLFQGQARGRVGDVVLSRLDGQQVSRVRNRNPRNPNTYRQRLQHAVAANVARLYSAGSAIFNHSWQGAKVGRGAQRRFMRVNMRLLRRLLLADIDNQALSVDSIARVGVPGLSVPVPFAGLQVSAGSLSQDVFSLKESSGYVFWMPRIPDNLDRDATIADYCSLMGLKPGDIFTFIGFNVKSSADYLTKVDYDDNNYDAVFPCEFQYVQLRLKTSALTDTTPMSSARFVMMFDGVDNSEIGAILVLNGFRVNLIFGSHYAAGDTILTACIASKENSPKRSTAFLMYASDVAHYGLTHQFVSSAWDKSAALDGSDLILEGENFPADSPTPTPIPVEGDIQIFANRECTEYADGSQPTVYARINNPWHFGETWYINGPRDGDSILASAPDSEVPDDPYSINLWIDWMSPASAEPYDVGEVVELHYSLSEFNPLTGVTTIFSKP